MPEQHLCTVKVFIADDSSLIRDRVASLLQGGAMTVVGHAETPQGAVEGILATSPDVVVLDVQLDGGSGLQVLRAVRQSMPGIAFVVFSGNSGPAYRKRYLGEGADTFLDKSAEFDQLVDAVTTASRHSRTHSDSLRANTLPLGNIVRPPACDLAEVMAKPECASAQTTAATGRNLPSECDHEPPRCPASRSP